MLTFPGKEGQRLREREAHVWGETARASAASTQRALNCALIVNPCGRDRSRTRWTARGAAEREETRRQEALHWLARGNFIITLSPECHRGG